MLAARAPLPSAASQGDGLYSPFRGLGGAPLPHSESPYQNGEAPHINGFSGIGDVWKEVTQLEWLDKRRPPAWFQAGLFGPGGPVPLAQETKLSEVFDIVMLVDNREKQTLGATIDSEKRAYVKELASNNVRMAVEFRTLNIGDVMWVARHRENPQWEIVLDMIAERKSCSDLFSSITGSQGSTNRYWEQKRRIVISGISRRLYIVEGGAYDIEKCKSEIPLEKRSRMFHTALDETHLAGFQIIRSDDVLHTVRQLLAATRRLCLSDQVGGRNLEAYMRDEDIKKVEFEVFNGRMAVREDGAQTVGRVTESMLYQVPGMGKETVQLYLRSFPTLQSFFVAFEGVYTLEDAAQVLRQRTHMTRAGKPTKLEETLFRIFGQNF